MSLCNAYEQATAADHMLATERVLHMVEVDGRDVVERTKVIDAMYVETMQENTFALPMLGSKNTLGPESRWKVWLQKQTVKKKCWRTAMDNGSHTKALKHMLTELTQVPVSAPAKQRDEKPETRRRPGHNQKLPNRKETTHGLCRAQLQLMCVVRTVDGAVSLEQDWLLSSTQDVQDTQGISSSGSHLAL